MNIIKRFFMFIKNLFTKQNKIKELEAQKQIINNNKKSNFATSLKTDSSNTTKKRKIETLVCEGDGLGIQGKIDY